MRVLIVDTYYAAFLRSFYESRPGLSRAPYEQQRAALLAARFGTSDFLSSGLRWAGHEAKETIANVLPLQARWLHERHGLRARLRRRRAQLADALLGQAEAFAPDVVYVQNVSWLAPALARELRARTRLLVGQHATQAPPAEAVREYDLLVSSLPNLVEEFRAGGANAVYLPLAFGEAVLDDVEAPARRDGVVHVGGYGEIHAERNRFLEHVAEAVPVDFWGYALDGLPRESRIRARYRGEAWGLDMYRLRAGAALTLTKHIEAVAGAYANNATMFETTGVGGCLVVDRRRNLGDLFAEDEVVAYDSAEDCAAKVRHLLGHEDERARVAGAGRARTLRDHTYTRRMEELAGILEVALG